MLFNYLAILKYNPTHTSGRGSQIDSEAAPPNTFLRGLGNAAAGSEAPAVVETESYKALVGLLSSLRKKKAALSRLEDSLGTWKSRGLDLGLELLDRVTSAQGSTRDQLDSVREFLNTASKAGVCQYYTSLSSFFCSRNYVY